MTDTTAVAQRSAEFDRTDRETRRNELSSITSDPASGSLFKPDSFLALTDMGSAMSQMGVMVSPIYRGKPQACMGLIAICAPYGLNPIQVSWKTYKASKSDDAPIAYEAQVVAAMINRSGQLRGDCLSYEFKGEGNERQVIVRGELRDGEVRELITPKIKDINPKNSPLWKSDPDQQLCYYGARSWARRFMPQMLLGVVTVDEVQDFQGPDRARDITPEARPSRRGSITAAAPEPEPIVEPEQEIVQDAAWVPEGGEDGPDPTQGNPMADAYDEGVQAHRDGLPYDSNPHDGQDADDWAAGWVGAEAAA